MTNLSGIQTALDPASGVAQEPLLSRPEAFAVRQAHFPDEISFFAPGLKRYAIESFVQKTPRAFLPVSVTGSGCALNCDHCNCKILEPMIPLDHREGLFNLCKRLAEKGTQSVLVSGGSLRNGEVPLDKHMADLARVKSELGLRIIVHTGLVRHEALARGLRDAGVDGVALDIIGAEETIREVYHLEDTRVADFDRSLEILAKYGLSLRPHVILGLHYGRFLGEYQALEMIAKYPVHALIIVILTPMHDTPMFGVEPPPLEEVESFFKAARRRLPDTNVMLGCARPLGEYKVTVDHVAVECGLNGIAYPAEGVVEHARALGLNPVFIETACSCGC